MSERDPPKPKKLEREVVLPAERPIDIGLLAVSKEPLDDVMIFRWARQQLGDDVRVQKFQELYLGRKRAKSTAHVLNLLSLFGVGGMHRFYLGDIALGFAHLFTIGFLWIGTIVDIFNIERRVNEANVRLALRTIEEVRAWTPARQLPEKT
jgi:TM2 domain-containing membrane protein YozV